MHHGRRTIAKRAPWPFRLTEHVMCVWGKELCADAKLGVQALRVSILKHRITVEFDGGGIHIRESMVFGVSVSDFQEDGLKGRACFVFRLEKTHPHVMYVVVNDEQAVAKAMRGRNIDMAPNVA
jgi:hypothetical protein